MADQQLQQQLTQDANFLQPFINDGTRFCIVHQATLNDILRRSAELRGRRGGPSRQMLLDLVPLLPGNANFHAQANKATIVAGLLQMVAQLPAIPPQPNVQPNIQPQANPQVIPNQQQANPPGANNGHNGQLPGAQPQPVAAQVPAGWEHFFDNPANAAHQNAKILLQLKRGPVQHSPHRLLQLLIEEQEEAKQAQQAGDQAFLTYVRDNLQEMARNVNPLPPNTPAGIVWSIYLRILQTEIDVAAQALDEDIARVGSQSQVRSDERSQPVVSSSDSDLDSYAPNKRFAPPRYKKRRKKKRKKSRRSSRRSRSSSNSDRSSTSGDEEPNSKRVRAAAYDGTHLERVAEFRDEHKVFYRNGRVGWPSDDAISFIAKKFARPGTNFADKGKKGVKRVFGANQSEREHARIRTAQIYEMADEMV